MKKSTVIWIVVIVITMWLFLGVLGGMVSLVVRLASGEVALKDGNVAVIEVEGLIRQSDDVRKQLEAWERRLKNHRQEQGQAIQEAAAALKEKLYVVENELIVPAEDFSLAKLFDYPTRLNGKLAGLVTVVNSADTAPTQQSYDVFEMVAAEVDEQVALWQKILETEVAAFNKMIKDAEVPAVGV